MFQEKSLCKYFTILVVAVAMLLYSPQLLAAGWSNVGFIALAKTFHTLPTKSGPGFNVCLPGFHPEGVASVPLEFRTS